MENGLKDKIESGWKDNATSILKREVSTRSRTRENSQVLNQKT
jgi:hypothetical protein